MKRVNLEKYSNIWYEPGNRWKRIIWYLINITFFNSSVPYPYKLKVFFLRLLGAKVGNCIVIKPNISIKYPWFLEIGNNVWIGEETWIDNLTHVRIGSDVCISQGAYILTGNHNYKKDTFDLIVAPVIIEDGVWIGAKAIVCPGVTLKTHSVITVGSVVTKNTEPYTIYQGIPVEPVRERVIE